IITVETKEDVAAGKQVFSNLGGGIYLVEVTDSNGCTAVKDLIQIDEPLEVAGIPTPGPESCAGADGVINLVPSGGNGFYSYLWEKLDDVNFTSTDQNLSGLAAGTYKCTITDTNGCIGVVDGIVVDAPFDCNQLFPTQTDCDAYLNCDTSQFVQEYLCVTTKRFKGKFQITNVFPGAFFYFGDFFLNSIPDNPITVQVVQEVPVGLDPILYFNNSNVRISTDECGTVPISSITSNYDESTRLYYITIVYTPISLGTQVVEIKYDSKSNVGKEVARDATFEDYLFGLIVDGTPIGPSFGSLAMNLDPNCVDIAVPPSGNCENETSASELTLQSENLSKESITTDQSLQLSETNEQGFSVAPVPFNDQLSLRYEFDYTSDVKIQFFDLNGSLLRTYADKQVTNGDETQINIDFALKANQVYIMRVETDRDSFSKQVMSGN
ncbi:MAG: hypothetical protein KJO51_03360, partial [Gramella sp.]|nr:hypothetical protein [Christiangramia sp.]